MTTRLLPRNSIEILEARIAPAALPTDPSAFVKATFGGPIEVHAGQVLSTTGTPNSGSYLLYVEKGNALVFFTDMNNNGTVEFNELTGIAAGDGLRLVSFVDIHGDIVTNLVEQTVSFPGGISKTVLSLSDSDSNPSNDVGNTGGDGRVVLNKSIEKIELRSLRASDLTDQNRDGAVDDIDIALRTPVSTYSIFGNIYAGKSFGATDGGLIIDATGLQNFGFQNTSSISVGGIYTGTATSGKFFTFGSSRLDDVNGTLLTFVPARGQAGGDIIGVKAIDSQGRISTTTAFSIKGVYAGDGGIGARGGNIVNVTLNGDNSGGYDVMAGNGGRGSSGGNGGSIINFSDLGSSTSQVRIVSGDGGIGTTGSGGAGGNFDFTTYNVSGLVSIELGSGGDGFKTGGAGASLTSGKFTQPRISVDTTGATLYGTTHIADGRGNYVPVIGTHQVVDFDLDGFGDLVVTTQGLVHQVIVYFGNGAGGFRTVVGADGFAQIDKIYLESPHNPAAMVVADLNDDGVADIAVASNDLGGQGVIMTYLARFEDTNKDGVLSSDEDLNGNGKNDFLGFTGPIYSSLPQLERGDPDTAGQTVDNSFFPFWQSPLQISALTAGDYDGDGKVELAVVTTLYVKREIDGVTGKTLGLSDPIQTLVFMQPDLEKNNVSGQMEFTGQFYVDFGTRKQEVSNPDGTTTTIPAAGLKPYLELRNGEAGVVKIETTALATGPGGSTYDVIIATLPGATDEITGPQINDTRYPILEQGIKVIDYSDRTLGSSPGPEWIGSFEMGYVDTNRLTGNLNIAPNRVEMGGSTVYDFNNDGIADLGIYSPSGYIVTSQGNNGGTPALGKQINGGTGLPTATLDNAGHYTGDYFGPQDTTIQAITSGNTDADGLFDDLVLLTQTGKTVLHLNFVAGPGSTSQAFRFGSGTIGDSASAFGLFYASSKVPAGAYTAVTSLNQDNTDHNALFLTKFGSTAVKYDIVQRTFTLFAGDGGDSSIASGGKGGALGSGGKLTRTTDLLTGEVTTDFVGTLNFTLSGDVRVFAGDGGDGFVNGGAGGAVNGVTTRPLSGSNTNASSENLITSITAGDGGRGVTGTGGTGGTVSQVSLYGAIRIAGGDGGDGKIGGKGGSLTGNGSAIFDGSISGRSAISVTSAGDGGNGTRGGGAGGSITNFHLNINSPLDGDLSLVGGDGGNSVSGKGGSGGSVVNSSPTRNAFIDGDIFLQGGAGGIGTTGGDGGSVTNFALIQRSEAIGVGILSVLGGQGGNGTAGNGGKGGSIANIDVPTVGVPGFGVPTFTAHAYDRVISGDGGSSSKGNGGAGGNVTNVRVTASGGSLAVIAGAGGDALKNGGKGGSLVNIDMDFSASTISKGLLIAGAGGNGHAFVNPNDPNAFGGTIGRGGDGGSISGVSQTGNLDAHIDLIAGNGGDTVNYSSSVIAPKVYAGKGGSISSVVLSGEIGNTDSGAAIKSYNNLLGGETLAEYVNAKFRDPSAPLGVGLTDGDGNVGIVVGAAGRNKAVVFDPDDNPFVYETLPSGAQNGSLSGVSAAALMSAVAGSVDRIASIASTKNLAVFGEIGSDKNPTNSKDYLDKNGVLVPTGSPVPDGRLIDGALVTTVIDIIPAGRVFVF